MRCNREIEIKIYLDGGAATCWAHDIIISVISPGNGCDNDGQIIFYKARNDDIHPSEVSIMKLTLKYIMGSRQLCNQRRAYK